MAPKSNSGTFGSTQAGIKGAPALSFTYEYLVCNNLGTEVHAAVAGKHDLQLQGIGRVGSYWAVPTSMLLQYHINGLACRTWCMTENGEDIHCAAARRARLEVGAA